MLAEGPLEIKAAKAIEHYRMLDECDKVVVSVSGGPDSIALLLFLEELARSMEIELFVFHLDHMIRGAESKAEAEFVESFCRVRDLPVEVIRENVGELATHSGLSKQHFAREVRLGRLGEYADKVGAQRIAVGHTADDQVETFLMRIIQGAGLTGLSGISPVSGRIIRPLIETWRSEIDSYLEKKNVQPVTDSSNLEEVYLRNRIRHRIIPYLESEFGPGIKSVILREVDSLAFDHDFVQGYVSEALDRVARIAPDSAGINIEGLLRLHPSVQHGVIREAWSRVRPDQTNLLWQHVNDILSKVAGGKTGAALELPNGYIAEREYGDILIHARDSGHVVENEGSIFLDIPGSAEFPDTGSTVLAEGVDVRDVEFSEDPRVEFIRAEVNLPLELRKPRPGDKFWPIGSGGMKKLKDYFIDIKLPRRERRRCGLMLSEGEIVWVIGHRLDERFRIRPSDEKAIKLMIK